MSDALTGLFAALGILGALVERSRTGVGRRVEVSMLEATVAFATEPACTCPHTSDIEPRGSTSRDSAAGSSTTIRDSA